MKKVIKSRIFLVIITMIICISGTLYAATKYYASDVIYNSSDGSTMTVSDALNELYNKSGDKGYYYFYKDGTDIYYNPVSGKKCSSSEVVSTTGAKTGCMKWYTFNDSNESSTVNMILDHNTTTGLAWYSSNTDVAYESSNIKPEIDKLVSISGWVDTPRLIMASEIAQITGNTSWTNTGSWYYFDSNSQTQTAKSQGASKYAWLYDYSGGYTSCTSYGCNTADSSTAGYWTSTPQGIAGSGKGVWSVVAYGLLDSYQAFRDTHHGIRPVITIPKSRLS